MGKASSSKKVARAARTGGGRTAKGSSTSWFWPVFIGFVVVLGTAGIVYSKDQRAPDNTAPQPAKNGKPQDHWHTALGIYVCDKFLPNITGLESGGLHTHGDGLVHIEPVSSLTAGRRSTLGAFFVAQKGTLSASEVAVAGQPALKDGKKCGTQPALIQTKVWSDKNPDSPGRIFEGNPADIRPKNGELITIALVPKGADIPRPPSVGELAKQSTTSRPGTDTATSVPGQAPPDSSQPPDSTQPPDSQPAASTPDSSLPPAAPAETPTTSAP